VLDYHRRTSSHPGSTGRLGGFRYALSAVSGHEQAICIAQREKNRRDRKIDCCWG
jgi:hypothetical protein